MLLVDAFLSVSLVDRPDGLHRYSVWLVRIEDGDLEFKHPPFPRNLATVDPETILL